MRRWAMNIATAATAEPKARVQRTGAYPPSAADIAPAPTGARVRAPVTQIFLPLASFRRLHRAPSELEPRGSHEEAPEGQRASRVGMPSHKEHSSQYQQDEWASRGAGAPKRHRRSDQRHRPAECAHNREAEGQAEQRQVLHHLIDSGL